MRKVISVMLCVILMLTLAIPAYAVEVSQEDDMMAGVTFGGETTTVSEYEIALQKTEQMPMSVKSTGKTPLEEYKEAFDLRATLSPQELVGMGYTNDEVAVLKAYDEGNCSFEYAATYASASLTSSLYCVSRSSTQYKVRYTWAWDKMPTGTGEGGAALAIYGLNSSSQGFEVSKSGYLSNVNYFNTDNNSLLYFILHCPFNLFANSVCGIITFSSHLYYIFKAFYSIL